MAEPPFGHESAAIDVRHVLAIMGILVVFVLAAVGILYVVLHDEVMPDHTRVVDAPGAIPPLPRLQPHPDSDIAAERAQKQAMLSHYAWLDASHRFARIPIGRAMQLEAQQRKPQDLPAAATPDIPREAK